jgi:UPF0176 protein
MQTVINIAAYKFVELDDLRLRRDRLRALTKALKLKGTILLSSEGINLFVAGNRPAIDQLVAELKQDSKLSDLDVKESPSTEQPFKRMLVKIKKEVISFGLAKVDPRKYTSRRISPEVLCQWIDEGRNLKLLDVRNQFEVEAGTFEKSEHVDVDDFRSFATAASKLPEDLKQETVVTFCTGGIRCEKAAPFLEELGFRDVYQLDGGILRYFERCGGKHYNGECFVFDKRVAVDSKLHETKTAQCFACQATLSVEDQESPHYVVGQSCPHCYVQPEALQTELQERRRRAIHDATNPLPGSVPYVNYRPMRVPSQYDGYTVLEFVTSLTMYLSRDRWCEICEAGELIRNQSPLGQTDIVHAGDRILHIMPETVEPDINGSIEVIYEDESIVVINKPSPLPMHPCGRFNRNTLTYLLGQVFAPGKLRPAHRLDANTSGVVVFSKTRKVASRLQPQFEHGTVEKKYLARITGHPVKDHFVCDAAISSQPTTTAGLRTIDKSGDEAKTEIRVISRFGDGTSLVEALPGSGRTNQIRIHLWVAGLPIKGDPAYLANRQFGTEQTLALDQPPLCLFSAQITFKHPDTNMSVSFHADRPAWVTS